ncbi:MAG: zinc ribbon domain-containing protein [Acidobacteria bacterium]|nr:zinc ribbon domain-containing protein [Acidobacteriota bacterium]
MPLHEYQCLQCGRFELIQKFSDPPLAACPTCGKEVQKLLSAPAIQFKGAGWYVTDYAKKGSGGDGAGKSTEGAAKDSSPKETSSKDSSASGSSPTK